MFFKPEKLCVNFAPSDKYAVVCEQNPVFTWSAFHEKEGATQSAYKIEVVCGKKNLWESGWVQSSECRAEYSGEKIETEENVEWYLTLMDSDGLTSSTAKGIFFFACSNFDEAVWIKSADYSYGSSDCFVKRFDIEKELDKAVLYVCGVGYHYVKVNGIEADDAMLQPLVSNFAKRCYAVPLDITSLTVNGKNSVCVEIANGWRNTGKYFANWSERTIFRGQPQLMCKLVLCFSDGTREVIVSDTSWKNIKGAVIENNLFEGETYDARLENEKKYSAESDLSEYPFAVNAEPLGEICVRNVEPITVQKEFTPVSRTMVSPGVYMFDLGVNIAGVVRIKLPENMTPGQTITIIHSENLENDGTPSYITLRNVAAKDTYIAKGGESGYWNPKFVYHGFRYITVKGWNGIPDIEDITALSFYTDMDNGSLFDCGSAFMRRLHDNIVRTERNNLHGIATDCPQRDERMGWMNDATVRFEETSYNFNISRLFPKIINDIVNEQGEDGAITCTAPYILGQKPADPVSSSFIIAAILLYYHTGNTDVIKRYYKNFKAWNECLKNNSTDGIVDISYYGDWASPSENCIAPEKPQSAITPGILMSTGYHYYNYILLEKMARILGDENETVENAQNAERVKKAFNDKWVDCETGKVATGSQGCQAFALWTGILPEEIREKAALRMHEAVVEAGYKLTTGNLNTKYLIEMLSDYGYVDEAWRIMTREEYPSYGFMIQNGATTIWERFELKRTTNMNSHDHPMYGAVDAWMYSRIVGIRPVEKAWERILIKPTIPTELKFAEGVVDTVKGDVRVKWQRQYGKTVFNITVPFGSEAEFVFRDTVKILKNGFHTFEFDGE